MVETRVEDLAHAGSILGCSSPKVSAGVLDVAAWMVGRAAVASIAAVAVTWVVGVDSFAGTAVASASSCCPAARCHILKITHLNFRDRQPKTWTVHTTDFLSQT